MLDDETRAAIAADTLKLAREQWLADGEKFAEPRVALTAEDGEICFQYEGTTKKGLGSFQCLYKPRIAIEKIVVEADRAFSEQNIDLVKRRTKGGESRALSSYFSPAGQERVVRRMAFMAAMALLSGFKNRLADGLEDGYEESLIFSKSDLLNTVADILRGEGAVTSVKLDADDEIEKRAMATAKRTRTRLRSLLKVLPNLRPAGTRGRRKRVTKEDLLTAIERRRNTRQPINAKALAEDLDVTASAIYKAAPLYGIDLSILE